ncbi:hypothetical protein D3C80_1635040 [compost metagenome]
MTIGDKRAPHVLHVQHAHRVRLQLYHVRALQQRREHHDVLLLKQLHEQYLLKLKLNQREQFQQQELHDEHVLLQRGLQLLHALQQ